MASGFLHRISDEPNLEKQIEKQMGCLAGFFQMFDRPHLLAGKRLYSTRRLASASTEPTETTTEFTCNSLGDGGSVVAPPPPAGNIGSPMPAPDIRVAITEPFSKEPINSVPKKHLPRPEIRTLMPEIPQIPAPVFEFKDSSRSSLKLREAPRLSLDSRSMVDRKGNLFPRPLSANRRISPEILDEKVDGEKQRRSPTIVARLMGLEALPDSGQKSSPELRRSASESRANRDLFNSFQFNSGNDSGNAELLINKNTIGEEKSNKPSKLDVKSKAHIKKNSNEDGLDWNLKKKKMSYDSLDFFPESKRTGMIYGEIEWRSKMRGIDEPSKDLETLKQILEALQLKGLLHSRKSEEQNGNRNLVHDRFLPARSPESPIVVMKPTGYLNKRSPVSGNRNARLENSRSTRESFRRNLGTVILPSRSDRPECERKVKIRNRQLTPEINNASCVKSPSSLNRRSRVNLETERKGEVSGERLNSSGQSLRSVSPKKIGTGSPSKLQKNNKQSTEASKKDRNFASTELQRVSKQEKVGRKLLDRCDKLILSIAEVTEQPSPVSVLDSSFYKDDTSNSPVLIRYIKENESDLNVGIAPIQTNSPGLIREDADDDDFVYVSEILRNSEMFEIQRKTSSLQRKLVFDTVMEILQKKNVQFFSKKKRVLVGKEKVNEVWSEFLQLRQPIPAEDTCDVVCGVLEKDMGVGSDEWKEQTVEISEAVLYIERLVFKDLIAETIRELAVFAGKWRVTRRKLVFE